MARSGGSKRGFAAMSKEKQREIASKGGKASHRNRGRQSSGNQASESALGGVQGFDDTDSGSY